MSNPFRFATPFTRPDELVGRTDALARLLELAESGTYTMLEAPRRYGKTSLVKAAAHAWRDGGGFAVWIDFSAVLTIGEAARRFEEAHRSEDHGSLRGLLAELLSEIRLRLGPIEVGRRTAAPADPEAHLHELLEVAAGLARRSERRALVCLDEFQDVLAVPGLDGLLRSRIQHQADQVSYVFAGSEPSLLRELFAERSRPLFAQAKPYRLGRIAPGELAGYITGRLSDTGREAGEAATRVAELGAGHPQRTMLLAWHLWDLTPEGGRADLDTVRGALDSALVDIEPELDAVWRGLAGNERRVAVALAAGLAPLGTRARRATGLASVSAAQRALEGLVAAGHAEREPGPALVDPLFALWLRSRHEVDG